MLPAEYIQRLRRIEVRSGVPRDVTEAVHVGTKRLRDDLGATLDERAIVAVGQRHSLLATSHASRPPCLRS